MKKEMNSKYKILVVDDTPKNIQVISSVLQAQGYSIGFATNGKKALESVGKNNFDLILMDVMMPEMDGFEACKILKSDAATASIPLIFITAKVEEESISKGFELGGVDYIAKPFKKSELIARVKTHLELKDYRDNLEQKVHNLTSEIENTQKEVVFTMGAIGETRSKETGNHVKRVAEYSKLLAKHIGMNAEEAELLKQASPMHDIGKVGIPDSILNKPGKHDAKEWEIMKTHATLGYEMLKHSQRPILKTAAIVALEHHEKWNGTGYPRGLSGRDIHIYGRITAVADVFDALGSDRCYKKAWDDERILDLLKEERGKHFDPELIDAFFEHIDDFFAVREKFKDIIEE